MGCSETPVFIGSPGTGFVGRLSMRVSGRFGFSAGSFRLVGAQPLVGSAIRLASARTANRLASAQTQASSSAVTSRSAHQSRITNRTAAFLRGPTHQSSGASHKAAQPAHFKR